ncbi:hypothetical protein DDIC_13365 [Desulfovibrio desulfuricans]|uniref:Uncharacterized protein n=1 Tax=Desulfovibrio desulfuricans TaxID=876 RepID=A0A4P7UK08_DESDE|nr:hypothetical protein [Desulfovibrio desulfuricans]QCC86846.1 hypothetical protein DDIC_13365 [Desulfovibrio desulfuricans]
MSAVFAPNRLKQFYITNCINSLTNAVQNTNNTISEYKTSLDVVKFSNGLRLNAWAPLKYAAYLMGHLDGTYDAASILDILPASKDKEFFEPYITKSLQILREMFETCNDWKDTSPFDPLRLLGKEIWRDFGVHSIEFNGKLYFQVIQQHFSVSP